jgi:hypothetical protein
MRSLKVFETSVTVYESSLCDVLQDFHFYFVCPQAVQMNATVGQGRPPNDNISVLVHVY